MGAGSISFENRKPAPDGHPHLKTGSPPQLGIDHPPTQIILQPIDSRQRKPAGRAYITATFTTITPIQRPKRLQKRGDALATT